MGVLFTMLLYNFILAGRVYSSITSTKEKGALYWKGHFRCLGSPPTKIFIVSVWPFAAKCPDNKFVSPGAKPASTMAVTPFANAKLWRFNEFSGIKERSIMFFSEFIKFFKVSYPRNPGTAEITRLKGFKKSWLRFDPSATTVLMFLFSFLTLSKLFTLVSTHVTLQIFDNSTAMHEPIFPAPRVRICIYILKKTWVIQINIFNLSINS